MSLTDISDDLFKCFVEIEIISDTFDKIFMPYGIKPAYDQSWKLRGTLKDQYYQARHRLKLLQLDFVKALTDQGISEDSAYVMSYDFLSARLPGLSTFLLKEKMTPCPVYKDD